jgi:hypothetical protein
MRTLAFLLAMCAAGAWAAEDVGLVNHLGGEATYTSGGSRAKASAFMKVREGDSFTLASGAQLRLVYFQGSRQETFAGPARFTVGRQQSSVHSGGEPKVSTLPSGVSQRIAGTPELMAIAKLGRAGGISVRSGARIKPLSAEQKAEIAHAYTTYDELRRSAPEEDITPELYLFSVLEEHRQYQDLKLVATEMRRRQPSNADLAAIAEYAEDKAQGR